MVLLKLKMLIILSIFSTKKLLKSFARVLSQVVQGSGSGSFLLRMVLDIQKELWDHDYSAILSL